MNMLRLPLLLSVLFLGAVFVTAGCQAPEAPPATPEEQLTPVMKGEMHYVTYCQNCHGPEGKGDGPIAEMLRVPPGDLTTIAAENGGVFPVDRLHAWIDGREGTEMHGPREMPVWGNIWTDAVGGTDVEQNVSLQIDELTEYIRSIQVPAS